MRLLSLVMLLLFTYSAFGQDRPTEPSKEEKVEFDVHAGTYLWYYQPLNSPANAKPTFDLYTAWVDVDAKYGDYGFHIEPKFRETKLRPFFGSNVWMQEYYGFYQAQDWLKVKVGKVYTHFGLFWDDSFYGNIQYFDGLKLSADNGVSFEGVQKFGDNFSIPFFAQYFAIDGTTNGSLAPATYPNPTGRDTVSVPGAHKRSEYVLRAEPTLQMTHDLSLTVGVSNQHFTADLGPTIMNQSVDRYGADFTVNWTPAFAIYAEYAKSLGQFTLDWPLPGAASRHSEYTLAGTHYIWGKWTARYNYSAVNYQDSNIKEFAHVPAIGYALNPHINLLLEYAYWYRTTGGVYSLNDNSLNTVLKVYF